MRRVNQVRTGRVASVLGALAATFVIAGCSSRNPDSLIGMNVDENLAVMDANETSDANAAGVAQSGRADSSSDVSAKQSDTGSAVANANSDTMPSMRNSSAD